MKIEDLMNRPLPNGFPMSLSIVVPCYNEEVRIPRFEEVWEEFIQKYSRLLESLYPKIELIFVNDGSKDNTLNQLVALADRLPKEVGQLQIETRIENLKQNSGKGSAVQTGMIASRYEQVLITDVDLSTPLEELFRLSFEEVDLAFGSRALKDSKIEIKQNGLRPLLGKAFNLFMRALTGIPFADTQCGFKLLEGSLARRIAPRMTEMRFAFDPEMILLANQERSSMSEVPVVWRHQEPSRVSPIKDGLKMALKVVQFAIVYPRFRKTDTIRSVFETRVPLRTPSPVPHNVSLGVGEAQDSPREENVDNHLSPQN